MFEAFSYITLQQYWWIIVSLLGAILVFLMFVQGGQTLIYTIGKTNDERTILINLLGRKWEFTFTTLVTFGGAFSLPSLCSIQPVLVEPTGCGSSFCSLSSYRLYRTNTGAKLVISLEKEPMKYSYS